MKNKGLLPGSIEGNICGSGNKGLFFITIVEKCLGKQRKNCFYLCKIQFSVKIEYFMQVSSLLLYLIICA